MGSSTSQRNGRTRVLVVDDYDALRQAFARCLRKGGFVVTECESGTEALALVTPDAFDVVVSDIDMPGLRGIDLLRLLRERQVEVPVVLMTGNPTIDSAVEAVEHGAFKYLRKPVSPAELCATVERAASSRVGSGVTPRKAPSSGGAKAKEVGPATRADVAPGVIVAGRYRLVRLLGEGGMSQVWEATQLRTGRGVALKLLLASLNARPDMRARLLREARAASQVGHPNVGDVFDVFELPDGTPVLVMALLRGQTLAARLARGGGLPLKEAVDLLLPVVSAVGTAHERGVIHRDLKPDNIFLADEGGRITVKVLDFGIAKLMATEDPESGPLTATGALVGTPGYMSPEQGMGERDIDPRTDVWAIGAILYEALTGVRAVPADNIGQMLKALLTEKRVPIRRRVPRLPRALASLIDSMLESERDERPDDLRTIYTELSRRTSLRAPRFGPPSVVKAAPTSGVVLKANEAFVSAPTEQGDTPALVRGSRR